jgi:hypothetical protein
MAIELSRCALLILIHAINSWMRTKYDGLVNDSTYLGGGESGPDDEGDNGDEENGNDKAGVVNSKNLYKTS